jgi:outer membrane lipoprotein-sorting protein
MVKTAVAVVLALAVAPAFAQQKNCEELKGEIDAKIKKNGVASFSLTVVGSDAKEDGKVVGTCEGGTKKIVYKRGG